MLRLEHIKLAINTLLPSPLVRRHIIVTAFLLNEITRKKQCSGHYFDLLNYLGDFV